MYQGEQSIIIKKLYIESEWELKNMEMKLCEKLLYAPLDTM